MDQPQAREGAGRPRGGGDAPVPREVIQDRYDGLIGSSRGNIDTKLGLRLMDTLGLLVERTARHPSYTEADDLGQLVDDVLRAVERMVVDGVHRSGAAR